MYEGHDVNNKISIDIYLKTGQMILKYDTLDAYSVKCYFINYFYCNFYLNSNFCKFTEVRLG